MYLLLEAAFPWRRVARNRGVDRLRDAMFKPKPGDGAAQESNLPSRGLHDRTGFEDRLGHRAHAAPNLG
jgi:hypothetical protein